MKCTNFEDEPAASDIRRGYQDPSAAQHESRDSQKNSRLLPNGLLGHQGDCEARQNCSNRLKKKAEPLHSVHVSEGIGLTNKMGLPFPRWH